MIDYGTGTVATIPASTSTMMTIALATNEKQLNLSTAYPLVSLPAVACAGCIAADVQRVAHVAPTAARLRSWALTAAPLAVTASWF